jgi:uncharacterized membrane protein
MTLSAWLDARRPAPPARLRARIDAALGDALHEEVSDVATACLRAGEQLARTLLRQNAMSRDSALDLLAADALVTYAFESASERPAELTARSREAMARIAALADASTIETEAGR